MEAEIAASVWFLTSPGFFLALYHYTEGVSMFKDTCMTTDRVQREYEYVVRCVSCEGLREQRNNVVCVRVYFFFLKHIKAEV